MADIRPVYFPGFLLGIPGLFLGEKIPGLTEKTLASLTLFPGRRPKITHLTDT
jgi:hypothetical protein